MRLLLDSHALIWAVSDDDMLGAAAGAAIGDGANALFVSAGTVWEIGIKSGLGKLELDRPFHEWMNRSLADLGAAIVPITVAHAHLQGVLPRHHGDPFDRLIVAQAAIEGMTVVSQDRQLLAYDTELLWD